MTRISFGSAVLDRHWIPAPAVFHKAHLKYKSHPLKGLFSSVESVKSAVKRKTNILKKSSSLLPFSQKPTPVSFLPWWAFGFERERLPTTTLIGHRSNPMVLNSQMLMVQTDEVPMHRDSVSRLVGSSDTVRPLGLARHFPQ
jgi:hypothetical protein